MSDKCGVKCFSSNEGVDQWWECDLDAGHKRTITLVDKNGQAFEMEETTEHNYVECDAPTEGE